MVEEEGESGVDVEVEGGHDGNCLHELTLVAKRTRKKSVEIFWDDCYGFLAFITAVTAVLIVASSLGGEGELLLFLSLLRSHY